MHGACLVHNWYFTYNKYDHVSCLACSLKAFRMLDTNQIFLEWVNMNKQILSNLQLARTTKSILFKDTVESACMPKLNW